MKWGQIETFRKIVATNPSPWAVGLAQVDLDGLGSAYGTVGILRGLGVEAHPYYGGEFDDAQNLRAREVFRLDDDLRPFSALPDEGPIAIVDSCKLVDARFGRSFDPHRIKIVTDHHFPDGEIEGSQRFVHLSNCGAASTLVWEQAQALGVALSPRACALIALGIHSDTNKLRSPATTEADCLAFVQARSGADIKAMEACFHYPLPNRYFKLTAETYAGWKLIGPALVSHATRRMRSKESGYISRHADNFLQLKGPTIVVVWCLMETHVRFSFRTERMDFELPPFIDAVCGKGNGGAKHGSGGARVPLSEFPVTMQDDYGDEMIEKIDEHVRARIETYFKAAR